MKRPTLLSLTILLTLSASMVVACTSKETSFDVAVLEAEPVGLKGTVALPDHALGRVLFLTAKSGNDLQAEFTPVGHNIAVMQPSTELDRLYVLSRGALPRRSDEDERPQLTIFDGNAEAADRLLRAFELDDPMERLAIDQQGQWVAAFGGDAKVVNPNELVLFDLSEQGGALSRTIRSFGGAPVELLFTQELAVPEGPARRFLVVRTDRDVTLIDLTHLDEPEVTIKLPKNAAGDTVRPLQIVYDDGDPDDNSDARLAVRLEGTSDVLIVGFSEPTIPGRGYSPNTNIVDVGGVPSAIDFVRTDGGLRLAALVPSLSRATLVNPATTLAEVVSLPHAFSAMRRITSAVSDAPESGDVALLWGTSKNIAFWSLGSTSATPYRSIDTAELSFVVTRVIDVPAPSAHLKVLRGTGHDIFVLDLEKRQSFPLNTSFSDAAITVSADGQRLWAYENESQWFSAVRLADLHPQAVYADGKVDAVFDVERIDGGRAAIALHLQNGWDATLLDAETPDSASTHYYPALHLKGLEQ